MLYVGCPTLFLATITANGVLFAKLIAFLSAAAVIVWAAAKLIAPELGWSRFLLAAVLGGLCGGILVGVGLLPVPTSGHRAWEYAFGIVFGALLSAGASAGLQKTAKTPE